MNRTLYAASVSALALATTHLTSIEAALACGGLFCAQTPVVQTGEQIIFTVDHGADTVQATIQISYSGPAESFAWLLPLQSTPTEVQPGSNRAFQAVGRRTQPQFVLQREFIGQCNVAGPFGAADAGAAAFDSSVPSDAGGGGVQVLREEQVGPYESVVLGGTNPDEIRSWLEVNGYQVTDQMMEAVVPYISKGDVLLALRLRKNSAVGDLQPISLTMAGAEACVPIRLTAIAATSDMDITVYVLNRQGRAIPENFLHVKPNLARIDWLRGGFNYRQVVGDAADEAGGHAFVTEYAGSSGVMRNQIYSGEFDDLSALRGMDGLGGVISYFQRSGLFARTEAIGVLRRHVPDETLRALGVDPVGFWQCPFCFAVPPVVVDGNAIADDVEARIALPERRAQAMFDEFPHLTRLFTLLDPEEMTLDPIFTYRAGLPDVSNTHRATLLTECRDGVVVRSELQIENDRTIILPRTWDTNDPMLSALPAAQIVERLTDGTVITDNNPRIDQMIPDATQRPPTLEVDSCACDASNSQAGLTGLALYLSALLLLWRQRRRPR